MSGWLKVACEVIPKASLALRTEGEPVLQKWRNFSIGLLFQ
jgi:hypothetical protein